MHTRLEEGYVLHSANGAIINRVFDFDASGIPRSSLRPGGGAFTRGRLQRVDGINGDN